MKLYLLTALLVAVSVPAVASSSSTYHCEDGSKIYNTFNAEGVEVIISGGTTFTADGLDKLGASVFRNNNVSIHVKYIDENNTLFIMESPATPNNPSISCKVK